MTATLAFQVAYSALGLFFASASIRLYGSWARTGGWYKLALAFVLTCLTVDSLLVLIQTVAVQPNRWLVGVLLACGALLVGLATARALDSLRTRDRVEPRENDPIRTGPETAQQASPD